MEGSRIGERSCLGTPHFYAACLHRGMSPSRHDDVKADSMTDYPAVYSAGTGTIDEIRQPAPVRSATSYMRNRPVVADACDFPEVIIVGA